MNEAQSQKVTAPGQVKTVTIHVNGRDVVVEKEKYTYEEIVTFAFPVPDFDNNTYKVTYFRKNENHEGSLTKGESINVKEGMSFTVIRAIRS